MPKVAGLAALLLCGGAAASATTLGFDGLHAGASSNRIALPGVTISEIAGGSLFVYNSGDFGMPAGGGFCALRAGFDCRGAARLDFTRPVSDLMLSAAFVGWGDAALLTAWTGDSRLGDRLVQRNGPVDLSVWSGISRVDIHNIGNPIAKGIAFGQISFNTEPLPAPVPPPVPVPPPASIFGLSAAAAVLTLVGAFRRRIVRA